LGWGFGNGLRAEIEGSFRNNKFQNVDAFGTTLQAGGNEKKYGAMVNVLYDIPVAPWVMPYIGAGVGYQWARWQNFSAYNLGTISTVSPAIAPAALAFNADATEGEFAYQAIAGVGFPIPAVPGLAFTLEYRFMGLSGERSYPGSVTLNGASAPVSIRAGTDYNHSILLGVRYNFGVAPPPPPPVVAPAPAPARSYLVFFDWDKYNLTDRAKQIIADAAANIPKVQHTRIEVNGYTDTSGTPKYNMGLSIRRANAVAAELVRLGVKKEEIAIQGFGETHLLVPTGPGVREPQNRRVEIIIK
jgi:outer membrane protein OmpA-like peptidoglycan-associated protein